MNIEYQVLSCVAQFCNRHGITIDSLPEGYANVLADHINWQVCGMAGNITISTNMSNCDLHITIQPNVILEWQILRLNHTDLEVAMVMAS